MNHPTLFIAAALFLSPPALAQSTRYVDPVYEVEEEADAEGARFFLVAGRADGSLLLVETDARHNPASDTLRAWIQPQGDPDRFPLEADLVLSDRPDVRSRVWIYRIPPRRLVVSRRRDPMLEFALGMPSASAGDR